MSVSHQNPFEALESILFGNPNCYVRLQTDYYTKLRVASLIRPKQLNEKSSKDISIEEALQTLSESLKTGISTTCIYDSGSQITSNPIEKFLLIPDSYIIISKNENTTNQLMIKLYRSGSLIEIITASNIKEYLAIASVPA